MLFTAPAITCNYPGVYIIQMPMSCHPMKFDETALQSDAIRALRSELIRKNYIHFGSLINNSERLKVFQCHSSCFRLPLFFFM